MFDNTHYVTQSVGNIIFTLFYIIGVMTLINMLIAMMSESYARVHVRI